MSGSVRIDDDGPILTLTLDRDEKRNAINDEMLATLYDQVRRFADVAAFQVLLLKAEGSYFSAGADLRSGLVPDLTSRSPRSVRTWLRGDARSLTPLAELLEGIEKPSVVAHQGPCFGGALELSLSFDFRLASEGVSYVLPETKMGAVPSAGGTARLTRLVGPSWARWLLIAGQTIDAAKAERIGLVHAVHPAPDFADEVGGFCRSLAAMPPETVAAAKIAIELSTDLGSAAARNVERMAASSLVFGAEFEARMAAAQARVSPK